MLGSCLVGSTVVKELSCGLSLEVAEAVVAPESVDQ